MNLVLEQIEPAVRIVPGEPMSVEQFSRRTSSLNCCRRRIA
jgi:hypothetical protein